MSDDDNEIPAAVSGTRRQVRELVDGTLEVKIHIDQAYRAVFHRIFPEIDMPVALAPLKVEAAPPVKPGAQAPAAPKSLAQRLHINGYFRNPKLWRAMHNAGIYTVQDHKTYLETCACLYASARCQGDTVVHHCPSSAVPAAGPELQPENPRKVPHWYGVPLCAIEHHEKFVHASHGATREDKQELVERAVAITAERVKEAMKAFIGIESLAQLTERQLAKFEHDLGDYELVESSEWH